MRILGLIPARGGSKGIPRKNLRPFAGKPLLLWTCEAALASPSLASVVLSTEDRAIAALGKEAGVSVPFVRPDALARDETPTLPVVQHALKALAGEGESYDAVCLLQPTNPLRTVVDIEASIRLFTQTGADSVVSVAPIPDHYHPLWAYLEGPDGTLRRALPGAPPPRRQELPPAWFRDGSIYLTRTEVVLNRDSLYGERIVPYRIPEERAGGIDTPEDLVHLEARLLAGPRGTRP